MVKQYKVVKATDANEVIVEFNVENNQSLANQLLNVLDQLGYQVLEKKKIKYSYMVDIAFTVESEVESEDELKFTELMEALEKRINELYISQDIEAFGFVDKISLSN